MSNIIETKEAKEPLTLEIFVSMGKTIANIYEGNEEEQAKVIGKYFDSFFSHRIKISKKINLEVLYKL